VGGHRGLLGGEDKAVRSHSASTPGGEGRARAPTRGGGGGEAGGADSPAEFPMGRKVNWSGCRG